MKIKGFEEFNETLYIFDLDDTLAESPSFEELTIKYLKEDITIKDMIDISINRIGVKISDLKWENGRIYVDDLYKSIEPVGNWVRKGTRVYLITPNVFNKSDISLPIKLKELSSLYKSIDNKCIVTARPESMRQKIELRLSELGLELPKFGLHMIPDNTKNAGNWKGNKIVEIIQETGFKKAIFYDDNSKFIKQATQVVKLKLPNLDFKTIKVI